ncbi:hypothetical protein E1B28_009942 [Marasmius oreades]|uniref:Uncharacterized protein n=1 Tax=Marasmius oreades TaxID=181124 RepID=A0A9P7UR96_9AGAR|nr:uncharacterized protein E1B28_009942 [Marasmius oreades]KAG7090860.1 hypothetical protein E1B28_009942 [Marasmius oreades]
MSKQVQSFPVKNVLRDLAALRVSGIDLASLLPSSSPQTESELSRRESSSTEKSLQESYEFVREARAAIGIKDRKTLELEVSKPLERSRAALDEVLEGLEGY